MPDHSSDASGQTTVRVNDVPAAHRFEIYLDAVRIGFADYSVDASGRYVFPHVEIDPSFGGRGLGGELVRGAMDEMRARRARVVAVCPFLVAWLHEHPDYHDLLAPDSGE
jgi:uncharacterized protein